MTDAELDQIEARANACTSLGAVNSATLHAVLRSDIPALVSALREARRERDEARLTNANAGIYDGQRLRSELAAALKVVAAARVAVYECGEVLDCWHCDDVVATLAAYDAVKGGE